MLAHSQRKYMSTKLVQGKNCLASNEFPKGIGANWVRVAMQLSTNLKDWNDATNGIYAGSEVAKFFRVKLDRTGSVPPIPPPGAIPVESGTQMKTLCVAAHGETDELWIGEYQSAELIAVGQRGAHLELTLGSRVYLLTGPNVNDYPNYTYGRRWQNWTPVRGPAKFRLLAGGWTENYAGYCTIRVCMEAYPADKTLTIPPSSNSCQIVLESSTDLRQWATAENGYYTNQVSGLFFRIRSTALP